MRGLFFLAAILVSATVYGQDTGAADYAAQMNRTGRLVHDGSYRGYEVIYYSSGGATREGAIASWMRSAGHRALLVAGRITDIACVGQYCCGRGGVAGVVRTKSIVESAPVADCSGGQCSQRTVTRSRFRFFR
jgi:hypothetical protein